MAGEQLQRPVRVDDPAPQVDSLPARASLPDVSPGEAVEYEGCDPEAIELRDPSSNHGPKAAATMREDDGWNALRALRGKAHLAGKRHRRRILVRSEG